MPDLVTTSVILLGRGSSDRMANGDVARMARWLFEVSEHELVDIAFTGITHREVPFDHERYPAGVRCLGSSYPYMRLAPQITRFVTGKSEGNFFRRL